MALQVPSYPGDPTSTAPLADAYIQVRDFHLDSETRTINFAAKYYRSAADYAAGSAPVNKVVYLIGPNPETRSDGASLPSYEQVVASAKTTASDPVGTLAFAIVTRSIYQFLLTLPEFAGSTVVA